MTQKHFIAIAETFNAEITSFAGPSEARDVAIRMAKRFAVVAASDNPKFDTQRFLRACGIN